MELAWLGAEVMGIDEQHPEQPGARTPLVGVKNVVAATLAPQGALLATRTYVGDQALPLELNRIVAGGIEKKVTTGFGDTQHDGVFAFGAQGVWFGGRQPNATVRVEAYDAALAPGSFQPIEMPMHAAGALASFANGVRLATIDNATSTLQIVDVSTSAPVLVRTHAIPAPTVMIAWAGDNVVLRFVDELLLIAADDSRTHVAFPVEGADVGGVVNLHAAQTPFGIALSITMDNQAYLGLLRDGAVEWQGPYGGPQSVYADLRWDGSSIGVYTVTSAAIRQLVYAGLHCPG